MKNQYFGDRRDYFKYELLDRLCADLSGIDRLTCVWMLTAPDLTGHGRVRFTDDPDLPKLTEFFRLRLRGSDPTRRRVSEMRHYFDGRPFEFFSYRDDAEDFGSTDRRVYFVGIPSRALRRAVVFFDPDNGLEPRQATEKHLRFEELQGVLSRMDSTSVAVIFQYARRSPRFWESLATDLHSRLNYPAAYIAEPTLAFYAVAKDRSRCIEIVDVLEAVARRPRVVQSSPRTVGRAGC